MTQSGREDMKTLTVVRHLFPLNSLESCHRFRGLRSELFEICILTLCNQYVVMFGLLLLRSLVPL